MHPWRRLRAGLSPVRRICGPRPAERRPRRGGPSTEQRSPPAAAPGGLPLVRRGAFGAATRKLDSAAQPASESCAAPCGALPLHLDLASGRCASGLTVGAPSVLVKYLGQVILDTVASRQKPDGYAPFGGSKPLGACVSVKYRLDSDGRDAARDYCCLL